MNELARALAVGGIGRAFFATVTARDCEAASALALLETELGPVVALEARRTACALVVQAQHAGGSVSQVLGHHDAAALAFELDGTAGSLRLGAGQLRLHRTGVAETIPLPATGRSVTEASVARLVRLLDEATQPNNSGTAPERGTPPCRG